MTTRAPTSGRRRTSVLARPRNGKAPGAIGAQGALRRTRRRGLEPAHELETKHQRKRVLRLGNVVCVGVADALFVINREEPRLRLNAQSHRALVSCAETVTKGEAGRNVLIHVEGAVATAAAIVIVYKLTLARASREDAEACATGDEWADVAVLRTVASTQVDERERATLDTLVLVDTEEAVDADASLECELFPRQHAAACEAKDAGELVVSSGEDAADEHFLHRLLLFELAEALLLLSFACELLVELALGLFVGNALLALLFCVDGLLKLADALEDLGGDITFGNELDVLVV